MPRQRSRPNLQSLLDRTAEAVSAITLLWLVQTGLRVYKYFSSQAESRPRLSIFPSSEQLFGWIVTLIVVGGWAGIFYLRHLRNRERRRLVTMSHSLDELKALHPRDFEQFVAELFRGRGYKARVVGRVGDHGVDIEVINPQGQRELVQCKRYRERWIQEEAVREFYGAFVHDGKAVRGYLVTTSHFSEPARAWARGKPIDLIDGEKLWEAVEVVRGIGSSTRMIPPTVPRR